MSDTTHKFRTRKEAQAAAKEARARSEAAAKAFADAETALQAAKNEWSAASRLADEAENAAAAVPHGSIVEVPVEFKAGRDWRAPWVKGGFYDAWTDDGEVRIKTSGGRGSVLPRGRYRVVWTPWMGTPRPDLDELNGKAPVAGDGGAS